MLTINQVAWQQGNTPILEDISCDIAQGKLYALIGQNGSGKSSLIKLMAGEILPSHGDIRVDDTPLRQLGGKALGRKIAYLPQNLPATHAFTVEELVMLGRYPWQRWLSKPVQADRDIVEHSMHQTQIQHKATQTVASLSGGERARAWLAMALAQQTRYLLLDELLAPLDIIYQVEILRLLRQLAKERELGVVLIIHDINLSAQFCDDIIALKDGKLCHLGSVQDTMTQAVLESIFGVSLRLIDHPEHDYKVAIL